MSLTGSRTLIRRSAEQWQEILQRFEHSGTDPASVLRCRGTGLEHLLALAAQAQQFPRNDTKQ